MKENGGKVEKKAYEYEEMFDYILDEMVEQNMTYLNDKKVVKVDFLGLHKTCPIKIRKWLTEANIKFVGMEGVYGKFQVIQPIMTKGELDQFSGHIHKIFSEERMANKVEQTMIDATRTYFEFKNNSRNHHKLENDLESMRKYNALFHPSN